MKLPRLLPWALVFLFATLSPLAAQTAVRVLDYNIKRAVGGSDSTVSAQTPLAKVINHLKPDVWTINELGGNSVSFNAANAHNFLVTFIQTKLTIYGVNPQENTNFFIYIGTINDGFTTGAIVSRYSFASTHTYSDAGGGYGALRGLVTASVNIPGTTAKLGVLTAHLKALDTTDDARQRQAEATTNSANLASWISSHPSDAVVVTGDWNETEDPGEPSNWDGHEIGDVLPNTGGQVYQPITTMQSPGLIDPSPASIAGNYETIDASTPDARFDYTMFVRSSFLGGQIFDTKQHSAAQLSALNTSYGTNFVTADSANASDHLPVLAVLQVGGAPVAPVVYGVTRTSTNLSITYQKVISSSYSYAVESSSNLASWLTVTPQDQILEQHGDFQTVKSTVPISGAQKLFLRVRQTVAP